MGQSASAVIFFGLAFDSFNFSEPSMTEATYEAMSGLEWGKLYLSLKGLPSQEHNFQADDEAENLSGCTLESYGWDGDYSYLLAIKDSIIRGDWEGSTVLDPAALIIKDDWMRQLRDFCEVMGIYWKEPKWHLVCSIDP